MWGKALRVIPRLSKDEWDDLDIVSRWLIATRAAVLVMTFISAAVAGIMAARAGMFRVVPWAILTVGLVLSHAANNLINDLTDFSRGVDKDNYYRAQYGPQPLTHGFMTPGQSKVYAAVTLGMGLVAGVYFVLTVGLPVLYLVVAGLFFVLFYTYPLKYIGLGELAVLVVWGPLMIGGGYFVITGSWDWNVVLAGLPYALGVTGVIFGKHIDKLDDDRARKIRTLPVLIGEKASRVILFTMSLLQYVLVVVLVVTRFFTPAMLVSLVALPLSLNVFRIYSRKRPDGPPSDYPENAWPLWFVAHAFVHNRKFGGLFLLGLIADTVLTLTGVF
jgi:1,4-dihydroxy-2-naphthoate octaprenyltransferase